MTPHRRTDDPSPDVTPEDADAFFAGLPQIIDELRKGRRTNRRLVESVGAAFAVFAAAAVLFGLTLQGQQDQLTDSAARDRVKAYRQCQLVNDNALTINRFLDAQIASVRMSRLLTPAEKAQRLHSLTPLKQQLPVCRRPR